MTNDGSATVRMAGIRGLPCAEPATLELNGRTVANPGAGLRKNGIGCMAEGEGIHLNTRRFCGRRIGDAI